MDTYLECTGANHSGPVVILEAALGSTSSQWAWIQSTLSSTMRVVSYDRAGLGWSELGPPPRDARSIANELHAALNSASIRGPYVLVGHSLGGLFVRVFACMFPDEVIGMVLVDATHPDQWTRLPDADRMRRVMKALSTLGIWLARFALFRIIDGTRFLDAEALPPAARSSLRAALARPQHWQAARRELAAWDSSTVQAREARWESRLPIMVVSASETLKIPEAEALQEELVKLSSCGSRQVAAGATHMSIVTNRDYSQKVVQAIRDILLM
jgi:pimeloyl-ACP methyl ester carboxylesterase